MTIRAFIREDEVQKCLNLVRYRAPSYATNAFIDQPAVVAQNFESVRKTGEKKAATTPELSFRTCRHAAVGPHQETVKILQVKPSHVTRINRTCRLTARAQAGMTQ